MLELEFLKRFLLSKRAGSLIRTIAWISIVSVAIGVMSLIVVVSVMNGFHDSIRKRLLAAEPHLVLSPEKVSYGISWLRDPVREFLEKRNAEINFVDRQDIIIRTSEGVFHGAEAKGVDQGGLRELLKATDAIISENSGQSMIPESLMGDADLKEGELMIGADFARSLGVYEGDKLTVMAPEMLLLPPGEAPRFERLTVKRSLITNVSDLDNKLFIYGRGKSLKGLGKTASLRTEAEILLPNANDAGKLLSELLGDQDLSKGLHVETWETRNSSLFQALRLEIFAIGLFLSLSTLIAGFSIVTVLLILITQKRKEIGIMMSIGLSRGRTRVLFTHIGMLLSSVGILSGAVMGVCICLIISSVNTSVLPEIYYETSIPAKLNYWFVISVVSFALALAYFASYIPAKRMTALEPADALRPRLNIDV